VFGTLSSVCGPGDAKGATERGVTDTSIQVGTLSDPGASVRPGLNQELFDSATAFTDWCNDAGGINGRKLILNLRDAKLFEVRQRMLEACQSDFFLVGGGTALDDQGVSARVACKLGEINSFENTNAATQSAYEVQPIPNAIDQFSTTFLSQIATGYPGAIKHYGLLSGDLDAVQTSTKRLRQVAPKLGYSIVYDRTYPPGGAADWGPYIEEMRSKGVRVLTMPGDPTDLASLQKAMKAAGWYPDVIASDSGNMYDRKLTLVGGDAIKNVVIRSDVYPFDEAIENPPTEQFLQTLVRYVPTAKVGQLGIRGWSAWLLWAQSAKACGSQLTRDCVLRNAEAVSNWTGGGLHAPSDPSARGRAAPCAVLLDATSVGFLVNKRLTNANTGVYHCAPNDVVPLTPTQ
jgi:ABC-type branched-subunit amino acid transport system substrate-binding protein